jgi:hypothetical protein
MTVLIECKILMICVEGNLKNDLSLKTNSTCLGIAGCNWLIGDYDGPEELHHEGAHCKLPAAENKVRAARATNARQETVCRRVTMR